MTAVPSAARASRIVVTRAIPSPALTELRTVGDVVCSDVDRPLEAGELHAFVAGADAAVTMLHDRVDAAFLDAAGERLRVVANVAVGFDNIDVAECARRGVRVTNTPDVLVEATADLTIGLILALTRRIVEGDALIRAGTPWSWSMGFMVGRGLQGKRLGLVGYGRIGKAVARRAAAFGMDVIHSSRTADSSSVQFDELLRTSDVVSLHCPLTPRTRHLIGAEALAAMQPHAYLINTARGAIVDEPALARALAEGRIAGAGLDVFENEPAVTPGLADLGNVVMTPHLGSATQETREAMAMLAARNVVGVLSGAGALTPVAV